MPAGGTIGYVTAGTRLPLCATDMDGNDVAEKLFHITDDGRLAPELAALAPRGAPFYQVWAAPLVLAGLVLPLAAYATTVTGTVTNKTTGRPDAKDTVVLLSLSQGMQPVASTKPDAQGHFSFKLPDNNTHLIRVTHQQASYYEAVPPGTTHVNVTV